MSLSGLCRFPRAGSCGLAVVIVVWSGALWAGDAFLGVSFGARPLSLGTAYTSVADGPDGGLWNPAGLAALNRSSISGSQNHLTFTENAYALSVNQPLGTLGTISVSALELHVANVALTRPLLDANGNPILDSSTGQPMVEITGLGDETDGEFLLGYGISPAAWLMAGSTLKWQVGRAGRVIGTGMGVDAGLIALAARGIRVGLVMEDLGTTVLRWKDGLRTVMEPRARVGVSWKGSGPFLLAADVRSPIGKLIPVYAFGTEYRISDSLVLRAGADDFHVSGGAGFEMPIGLTGKRACADYAFVSGGLFEDNNRLTLTVVF